MSAPVIVWIRTGVGFVADAAASFTRLEARLGRHIDVNSTYRDWDTQQHMYDAWQAWISGRGPKPAHSRALPPSKSVHCQGRALDSDDWQTTGFITLAAEYGWIRTAANDPTERHHFEYIASRDQHRNDPTPAAPAPATAAPSTRKGKNMQGVIYTNEAVNDAGNKARSGAVINTESGFVSVFGWFDPPYADGLAVGFGLARAAKVTRGQYNQLVADARALKQ